jgi:hypothetical protein
MRLKFSIRSLFLLVMLVALGASGARWWLRVSEEQRYLSEFDPTLNQIFDWPEDRKAIAKPMLDEMRSELMDAAWFGSQEQKLAICNRYIDTLAQSHHKSYRTDLGRAFADLGGILRFSDDETEKLAARLGFDMKADRRAMLEFVKWQEEWMNSDERAQTSR